MKYYVVIEAPENINKKRINYKLIHEKVNLKIILMNESIDPGSQLSINILTVGETRVGKTALIYRYIDRIFYFDNKVTLGIDFKVKKIKIREQDILLKIWDTAGQERYKTLTKQFYKNAEGIILVYDITERNSFLQIEEWVKTITENKKKEAKVILVGNKNDLIESRTTSFEEALLFSKKYDFKYFEASALSGENVDNFFEFLAEEILKYKMNNPYEMNSILLKRKIKKTKKEECCKK